MQADEIIDLISSQEEQRDATCWTTARMMENFYAGEVLTEQATLMRIQAIRRLLLAIWYSASITSNDETVTVESLLATLPDDIKGQVARRSGGFAVSPGAMKRSLDVRLNQFHEITEHYRQILTILYEYISQTELYQKRGIRLKMLSERSVATLASISTHLTIKLLEEARRLSHDQGQDAIEVSWIQQAYKDLKSRLTVLELPSPRPHLTQLSADVQGSLRDLSLKNMRSKIDSLKAYNHRHWKDGSTSDQVRNLLSQTLGLEISPAAYSRLESLMDDFAGLVARGHRARRVDSLFSSLPPYSEPYLQKRSADFERQVLDLLWVSNVTNDLLPRFTKENGDVVLYLSRDDEQPSSLDATLESAMTPVALIAHELDAVRDTTVHWRTLQRVWKEGDVYPVSPYGAELLAERLSEFALFVLQVAREDAHNKGSSTLEPEHIINTVSRILLHEPPQALSQAQENVERPKDPLLGEDSLFRDLSEVSGIPRSVCSTGLARFLEAKTLELDASKDKLLQQFEKSIYSNLLGNSKSKILQEYMGAGIAVGDYDGDGRVDLFLTGEGCNRLYRNMGESSFKDVTAEVGLLNQSFDSRQAFFVDLNNDRRLDLVVIHSHSSTKVYAQTRSGVFKDLTGQSGIQTTRGAHTGVFFDYDRDGRLDFFVGHYGSPDGLPSLDGKNGYKNKLFHNQGGFRFNEVSAQAGINSSSWTLASAAVDANGDGFEDLYLANDFGEDEFWINQQNGRFTNQAKSYQTNDRGSGMNVSLVDADGDLKLDIYITVIDMFAKSLRFQLPQNQDLIGLDDDILQTSFYLTGNKLFSLREPGRYTSQERNLFEGGFRGWSWGASFFDYENDGDEDMYLANGWIPASIQGRQDNQFFLNSQGRWFQNHLDNTTGFSGFSRAVTSVDINGDAFPDLVVSNLGAPAKVLLNNQKNENSFIQIKLHGVESNSFGVGARVTVFPKGHPPRVKKVTCGIGYLAQEDTTLNFGLGDASSVEKVVVDWPSGKRQTIESNLVMDSLNIIEEL